MTAYLEAVPRPRGRSGREAVVITDRLVTVHVVHDVEVTHLVLRRRPAPAQLTTGYQWPPQAAEGGGNCYAAGEARPQTAWPKYCMANKLKSDYVEVCSMSQQ